MDMCETRWAGDAALNLVSGYWDAPRIHQDERCLPAMRCRLVAGKLPTVDALTIQCNTVRRSTIPVEEALLCAERTCYAVVPTALRGENLGDSAEGRLRGSRRARTRLTPRAKNRSVGNVSA